MCVIDDNLFFFDLARLVSASASGWVSRNRNVDPRKLHQLLAALLNLFEIVSHFVNGHLSKLIYY